MKRSSTSLLDRLPYSSPLPSDPAKARRVAIIRVIMYVLVAAALVATVVQFEYRAYDALHPKKAKTAASTGPAVDDEQSKAFIGAVWRWRAPIKLFWQGHNIYGLPGQFTPPEPEAEEGPSEAGGGSYLHPNMPFTVMFLTPLAMMPISVMTLTYNLLKLAIIIACILMAASLCNHKDKRIPDWVVLLGLAWSIVLVIGDIQHGNTNTLVMGAVIGHLWLYRKGRDGWAGASLALAICLKMIPAIFLIYWLYQRSWKLLAATLVWLVIMVVALPGTAMAIREMVAPSMPDVEISYLSANPQSNAGGWGIQVDRAQRGLAHYGDLMSTWYHNLIEPGLIKASWYPIHINQSMSGVLSRLLLGGQHGGDIFWNPDDYPKYEDHYRVHGAAWIALASLDESTVKTIFRICQIVIVGLMGWAIGWRRLPRDDGRRALHYGMVIAAMLMLNQRTWDHHSGMMLLTVMAAWYAIAFGFVGRWRRALTLAMAIIVGPLLWSCGTENFKIAAGVQQWFNTPRPAGVGVFKFISQMMKAGSHTGKVWADYVHAYGTTFLYFLLMFACCVILALALKKQSDPYAGSRQKLGQ